MYQHDPYAGQYPQPPPLTSADSDSFHYSNNSFNSNYHPTYHNNSNNIITSTPSPIPNHYGNAELTHYNNSNNNLYNTTYNSQIQQQQSPQQLQLQQYEEAAENPSSLAEYLRREREEYLTHKNYKVTPVEPIHQQISYSAKPTPPPVNETDSYKPRPVYYKKQSRSCCSICCCYNPAMTCCSCFCMLISLAFVAAGIALIVASKIIEEKCSLQCDRVISQEQCGTICSSVLHDGMFYGGIAVAGLAALSVVWRLLRWTCAGCSQH